jgi:hypothetical protein
VLFDTFAVSSTDEEAWQHAERRRRVPYYLNSDPASCGGGAVYQADRRQS